MSRARMVHDAAKLRRRRGISYQAAMKLLSGTPEFNPSRDTKAAAPGKRVREGTQPGSLHNQAHHGTSSHGGNKTHTTGLTGKTVRSGVRTGSLHNMGYEAAAKGQHAGHVSTSDIDRLKTDGGQRPPSRGAPHGVRGNRPAPHRPTEDVRGGTTTTGKTYAQLDGAGAASTRAHALKARAKSMRAGRLATKSVVRGDRSAPGDHLSKDRIAYNAQAEGNPMVRKITKGGRKKHRRMAAKLLERQYT